MLQNFADTPIAYYNFQVLSSVSVNFLNWDTKSSLFQIIMCTFPTTGSQMWYTNVNLISSKQDAGHHTLQCASNLSFQYYSWKLNYEIISTIMIMEIFPNQVHYYQEDYNYIQCANTPSQERMKEFYPIHSIYYYWEKVQ